MFLSQTNVCQRHFTRPLRSVVEIRVHPARPVPATTSSSRRIGQSHIPTRRPPTRRRDGARVCAPARIRPSRRTDAATRGGGSAASRPRSRTHMWCAYWESCSPDPGARSAVRRAPCLDGACGSRACLSSTGRPPTQGARERTASARASRDPSIRPHPRAPATTTARPRPSPGSGSSRPITSCAGGPCRRSRAAAQRSRPRSWRSRPGSSRSGRGGSSPSPARGGDRTS